MGFVCLFGFVLFYLSPTCILEGRSQATRWDHLGYLSLCALFCHSESPPKPCSRSPLQ